MKVSPVESDGALLDVAGTIVADDAPIVAQPLPEGLLDVQLCLVRRGGENHFIFEHASSIAAGFIKPLTLSSHAGGIGRKGKEHVAGPWRYVRTGTVAADRAACTVASTPEEFKKQLMRRYGNLSPPGRRGGDEQRLEN